MYTFLLTFVVNCIVFLCCVSSCMQAQASGKQAQALKSKVLFSYSFCWKAVVVVALLFLTSFGRGHFSSAGNLSLFYMNFLIWAFYQNHYSWIMAVFEVNSIVLLLCLYFYFYILQKVIWTRLLKILKQIPFSMLQVLGYRYRL